MYVNTYKLINVNSLLMWRLVYNQKNKYKHTMPENFFGVFVIASALN